jgi:CBS domain-containing protein
MEENEAKSRVGDALVPSQYRVYPGTPLPEVVDLMVRRRLHAIPVVGERYEVLGILTSGDALAYMLSWGPPSDDEAPEEAEAPLARDVMTRSVLCVSEDQPLPEAANMLVNRDVEQLPVVREGEFIGFVTRDSVLRTLAGVDEPADANEDQTT